MPEIYGKVEQANNIPAKIYISSKKNNNHSTLNNRDRANQHPMSAITGLIETLSKKSGVYVGADEPTDPNIDIWIDYDDEETVSFLQAPDIAEVGQYFQVAAVDENGMVTAVEAVDMPSGGESYELPAATADALGGVKAEPATEADTQPVRIGADGMLFTTPGGGGEKWETIVDYTVPEDCGEVFLKTDIHGKPFKLKEAIATIIIHPVEGVEKAWAVRYTVDGTATSVYNCAHYAHGTCNAPSAAGKCSYARIDVVDTPKGVWIRNHIAQNDLSYAENGFSGGRTAGIHEDINMTTLESKITEISAIGIGSFIVCIGKGTRIVLMGVRE